MKCLELFLAHCSAQQTLTVAMIIIQTWNVWAVKTRERNSCTECNEGKIQRPCCLPGAGSLGLLHTSQPLLPSWLQGGVCMVFYMAALLPEVFPFTHAQSDFHSHSALTCLFICTCVSLYPISGLLRSGIVVRVSFYHPQLLAQSLAHMPVPN